TSSPYASPAANAPAAFVICYRREGLRFPEYADIDCAICAENIMLELEAQGLGGVMLGIAPIEDRMKAVADIASAWQLGCVHHHSLWLSKTASAAKEQIR
ncbi:MAG: nitroreductase family protein, partial [Mailhella sp.]|nr:nitroreductase family protein [Mailhella sp.]